MNAVVPFAFEDHLFRALDRDGEPWFIAGDVAKILGHAVAKDLTRNLDDDEKDGHTVPTPGGPQEVAIISEPGLYRAIIQRRGSAKLAPEVRDFIARFQRWVFHEVLPSLRRTGRYVMPEAPAPEAIEERNLRAEEHKLNLVGRMQAMKGPAHAFALWCRLGLPVVEPEPQELAAETGPERAFAADPLAVALEALAHAEGTWTGTPSQLYLRLCQLAPRESLADRRWPRDPQALGVALRRVTALLARRGIAVERRHSGARTVTVALAEV